MKQLCKNKHWKIDEEYDLDKILYLLIDRPSYINHHNDFIWENKKNDWHRDYDLPAHDNECGDYFWCQNNLFHRENNKPAINWNTGVKTFYNNGKYIKTIKIIIY